VDEVPWLTVSRVPQVFVSSTFFDLQQVRANIAEFVQEEMGYRLLASEHRSFPIDPSLDTIENCRRRVEEDADLLVLIVGARYGSEAPDIGKSVTNLEYLTARAKGIPIFVFVHRDVLALLPIVEKNPSADFTAIVDSVRLFDFVREIRSAERVWIFPFELANEIVSTLRVQLAYEMSRGLQFSLRARRMPSVFAKLTGPAFRIAAEQPEAWEAKLFARVLTDDINACSDLRRAHNLGLAIGFGEVVDDDRASAFVSAAIQDGERVTNGIKQVVAHVVNEGFRKEDIEAIVNGAHDIARTYKHALEWAARLRGACLPEDWRPLAFAASKLLDDFLREAEAFGPCTQIDIERALREGSEGPQRLKVTFDYDVGKTEAIEAELSKLRTKRGLS
jgi:hypothetical protein